MTEAKPSRLKLKRKPTKASPVAPPRRKPQVTNWEPDTKALTINDLINAPEAMKGTYTGKPSAKRKHPWEEIATEYIEGSQVDPDEPDTNRTYPRLKDLSLKYSLPIHMLKERSSKDQWTKKRQQFQIVDAQRRMSNRKFELLGKSIDFDNNAHKVAEMGMKLAQVRLGEMAQEIKARQNLREEAMQLMSAGMKYNKENMRTAVYPRELAELAKAMSSFQEIGMKALGTDVIRHEISGIDTNVFVDASTTNTQNNVSITEEMRKDDPERLASILTSLQDAELLPGVVDEIMKSADDEPLSIEAIPVVAVDDTNTGEPTEKSA